MIQAQYATTRVDIAYLRRRSQLKAVGQRVDGKRVACGGVSNLLSNRGRERAIVRIANTIAVAVGVSKVIKLV
jgi:hypothetical protein